MEGLFVIILLGIGSGILWRMLCGQPFGEAAKNTGGAVGGALKTAAKVGHFGWKVYRR